MNEHPNFYLTAAGEFAPLSEVRDCTIVNTAYLEDGTSVLIVRILPVAFLQSGPAQIELTHLMLSPRHKDRTLRPITSWPVSVYINRMLSGHPLHSPLWGEGHFDTLGIGQIYSSRNEALRYESEHARAVSTSMHGSFDMDLHNSVIDANSDRERAFKDELRTLIEPEAMIWKAYLVRSITSVDGESRHYLLIRSFAELPRRVRRRINRVYLSRIEAEGALDIVGIDNERDKQMEGVCRPFFVRSGSRLT
jgi:hypothetical protein